MAPAMTMSIIFERTVGGELELVVDEEDEEREDEEEPDEIPFEGNIRSSENAVNIMLPDCGGRAGRENVNWSPEPDGFEKLTLLPA